MVLEKHYFNNTDNFHKFDEVSGIYALLYKDEVLYVGQSVNVGKRLFQHHAMKAQINTNLKMYNNSRSASAHNRLHFYMFLLNNKHNIYFIVLPTGKDKLDEIEEHYITKYKPQYNWAGVRTLYPKSAVC